MSTPFILAGALALLYLFSPLAFANESSWNGHITPGSTTRGRLTPYYVPPGCKSYDSSSPFVHYTGSWTDAFSPSYVGRTLRRTSDMGSSVTFTFTGTGVEWFGSMSGRHGIANVLLDGQRVAEVDGWHDKPLSQQRVFWRFGLPHGKHTIKIVNTGKKGKKSSGSVVDLDAFVVTLGEKPPAQVANSQLAVNQLAMDPAPPLPSRNGSHSFHQLASAMEPPWTLVQKGSTGVHAMQLAVISESHALIIDKVEHNPLTLDGHPAWAALYNLKTHAVRALRMQSNSFCAGGTFLGNGTLINVGGNPVVEDNTSAADFGDVDGLQAVRVLEPCDSESADQCEIVEDHSQLRMARPRWYNTVLRISDGSAMVVGGSLKGGWINNATTNNPTVEYFPPKAIHDSNGLPIQLQFLKDTLNSNLFPIAFSISDSEVFLAANQDATIYDWKANTEQRLPRIPNGVRVTYPMTGTGLLLPLGPENNYTPEILLCGGSAVDDTKNSYDISSQDPASSQCARLVLSAAGIAQGWAVEQMPQARTMPDAVLLPTGQILLVNGAQTGVSGYGNVRNQVGTSNADNPALAPVLYDPAAPGGQRFRTEGMPASEIPRLYHSVATLAPGGAVMVAGSNPNLDRSEQRYGTEYRVEWFEPPYTKGSRPAIAAVPGTIGFGQSVDLEVTFPGPVNPPDVKVALMDLGFVTHGVHANSRMVYLHSALSADQRTLAVVGPPDGGVYPPGPGFLFVTVGDLVSEGRKVMIGDGSSPPVDSAALQNMLRQTVVDQYEAAKHSAKTQDGAE